MGTKLGSTLTLKTRNKMSIAHKGKKLSINTKKLLSDLHLGELNYMFGKKHSNLTRNKMSLSHRGKERSKSHCDNLRAALTGKKRTFEQCLNISSSLKGRVIPSDVRDKIRLSLSGERSPRFGVKASSETKGKQRLAALQRLRMVGLVHIGKSVSATMFLDCVEKIYGITICREHRLRYRFFDGRFNRILIEVDGEYWHRDKSIDILKTELAEMYGFKLERFIVNNVREIPKRLKQYASRLNTLFGTTQ